MSLTWPVLLCEGGGHAPGEEVLGRPVRMLHRALGGATGASRREWERPVAWRTGEVRDGEVRTGLPEPPRFGGGGGYRLDGWTETKTEERALSDGPARGCRHISSVLFLSGYPFR